MGADDDKVQEVKILKSDTRLEKNIILMKMILIVTGGKIDNFKKQTLLLMDAVRRINRYNVKLIVWFLDR